MLVFRSLNKRIDVRYDQRIYEATVKTLLDVIPEVEKKTEQIFLVGHNPSLEELLRIVVRRGTAHGHCKFGEVKRGYQRMERVRIKYMCLSLAGNAGLV